VNSHIFRSYDIRGIADEELRDALVSDIGSALGSEVRETHDAPVIVGRDARHSSPRIHAALIEGLLEVGCDVIDLGLCTTPMVYFAASFREDVGGLCMVTGSHNPPEHNGLKLGVGRRTMGGERLQNLRRRIESGEILKAKEAGRLERWDVLPAYLAYMDENLKLGTYRPKVILDAGNGVGAISAVPLMEQLGLPYECLYAEPDGSFPNHEADPTVPENLETLRKRVLDSDADLGVAYDGDADRIGVVDEHGTILWGDQLMVLFSRQILPKHPGGTIVAEVKCSQLLYDEIARLGGNGVMWKAGHTLIKDKMKETGALAAGEMSGHIFFADRYFGFDDACYATGRLLEILSSTAKSLSELLADLPVIYSTPEIRRPCPEELKFKLVDAVRDRLRKTRKIIDIDGVRLMAEGGFGLVRASNTQPLLVLRFEGVSEAIRDSLQAELEQVLEEEEEKLRRAQP